MLREDYSSKLIDLQKSRTPSWFGYLAQALLAVSFYRLNARKIDVRGQGHPDILMLLDGKTWRVEVEVLRSDTYYHEIKKEDVDAVWPKSGTDRGMMALLDMRDPVSWITIPIEQIKQTGRVYHRSILTNLGDKNISMDLDDQLGKIVADYFDIIEVGGYTALKNILKRESNDILFD